MTSGQATRFLFSPLPDVEWYNQGGVANPNLDPLIQPLKLSKEEVRALVAFLEAL